MCHCTCCKHESEKHQCATSPKSLPRLMHIAAWGALILDNNKSVPWSGVGLTYFDRNMPNWGPENFLCGWQHPISDPSGGGGVPCFGGGGRTEVELPPHNPVGAGLVTAKLSHFVSHFWCAWVHACVRVRSVWVHAWWSCVCPGARHVPAKGWLMCTALVVRVYHTADVCLCLHSPFVRKSYSN